MTLHPSASVGIFVGTALRAFAHPTSSRRVRRPHAPRDLAPLLALHHRDVVLALQIQPELLRAAVLGILSPWALARHLQQPPHRAAVDRFLDLRTKPCSQGAAFGRLGEGDIHRRRQKLLGQERDLVGDAQPFGFVAARIEADPGPAGGIPLRGRRR